jgi:hypothetical protein
VLWTGQSPKPIVGDITRDMTCSTRPSDHSTEMDLSVFTARDIRDILKSKAHCLRAGFPVDHTIISALDEILDDYVRRVGVATYLSQMLGDLANVPAQNCAFFDESEQPIEFQFNGNGQQPVQRFIARHFEKKLPFRLDIRRQPDSNRIETRYL